MQKITSYFLPLKLTGVIPIHKYKSKKSSLKVIIAKVDGPVVNGYFVLATEAHDDDGLSYFGLWSITFSHSGIGIIPLQRHV